MKQGFVELYTQRLIEGNIVKLKLSRLRSGMAKVSDSRGGSSYKDLGLSLGGGSSYKEINPVPEAARNRI